MRSQKTYFILTLLISILLGIILSLALGAKESVAIALIFSSIWWIYAVALFVNVFLIEGRHKRNKSEPRKDEDSFPPKLIQEWEALWRITVGRHKDPEMGNPDRN